MPAYSGFLGQEAIQNQKILKATADRWLSPILKSFVRYCSCYFQRKKPEKDLEIFNEAIVAITEKLLEYKTISLKQHGFFR